MMPFGEVRRICNGLFTLLPRRRVLGNPEGIKGPGSNSPGPFGYSFCNLNCLLLAAQLIFCSVYQSLVFLLTFFLLSKRFYRLHRDINPHKGFVAYYPSIVPGFDYVRVAGTKIRLGAIVHNHLHPTRNYIAGVAYLAAICLGEGLDVL